MIRMKARMGILIFLLFISSICQAIELDYLGIEAGMLFIGNSDTQSAPSPFIPVICVSLPLLFEGTGFYMLPRLSVSGTDYLLSGTKPVPAEMENAEVFVLLVFLDALFGFRLPLSEAIEMGFLFGVSGLFRIPIAYADASASETGSYISYFFGSMRFLYPETEISIKWKFTKSIGIIWAARAFLPLFHLWDGESLPFFDQLIVSGAIGFCIEL